MKKCPYCAEDVQDAAVLCKHCKKEFIAATPVPKPRTKWGRLLVILAVVIGTPVLMLQCSADHQRFVKFSEQRDAWHRKCDRYRTTAVSNVEGGSRKSCPVQPCFESEVYAAAACQRELEELTTYAKQQGWSK